MIFPLVHLFSRLKVLIQPLCRPLSLLQYPSKALDGHFIYENTHPLACINTFILENTRPRAWMTSCMVENCRPRAWISGKHRLTLATCFGIGKIVVASSFAGAMTDSEAEHIMS